MGAGASLEHASGGRHAMEEHHSRLMAQSNMQGFEAEVNEMIAHADRSLEENRAGEEPISNPLEVVFLNAGIPRGACTRSIEILTDRNIKTISSFERELADQREFLWIDLGITRKDMENIVRECKKISNFRGNVDAAIAAGLVDGGGQGPSSRGDDGGMESDDEDHAALMANLTNTQAFAQALNLDTEPFQQHLPAPLAPSTTAQGRLQAELQTVESNVDAINSRIHDLNRDINANQGTQKRMLTQLLSQQLNMESRMRARLEREREEECERRVFSEVSTRARERAVETRMEMLEMLNAAMEASNIVMDRTSTAGAQAVAVGAHLGSMGVRAATGGGRSTMSAIEHSARQAEVAAREAELAARVASEIPYQVGAGAASAVAAAAAAAVVASGNSHGSTSGTSSSSSSRRRARGGEELSVPPLCMWDLDLSSPFLEYSTDAAGALNRSGFDPSMTGPSGGADGNNRGNRPASLLTLSPAFSRGTKVSVTLSVEYLPPPSRAMSIGLNDNLDGTGTTSRHCHFSFGLALLDSMPPEGVHCLGKEPYTWGLCTTGRGSTESEDGREVEEGHVAVIASCGIPFTGRESNSGNDSGDNESSDNLGSGIVLRQGDILSAVLDLDPSSLTVLTAEASNTSGRSSTSSGEGGHGKGKLHLLHNQRLVHTFKGLGLDGRYVLGASLQGECCVRLANRAVAKGIAVDGDSSPHPTNDDIPASASGASSTHFSTVASSTGRAGMGTSAAAPMMPHREREESKHEYEREQASQSSAEVMQLLESMHAVAQGATSLGSVSPAVPALGALDNRAILRSSGTNQPVPLTRVHALQAPPGSDRPSLYDLDQLSLAGMGAGSLSPPRNSSIGGSGSRSSRPSASLRVDTNQGPDMIDYDDDDDPNRRMPSSDASGRGATTQIQSWARSNSTRDLSAERARERERLVRLEEEQRSAYIRRHPQYYERGGGESVNPSQGMNGTPAGLVPSPGRTMFGMGNQSPQLTRPSSPPGPSPTAARRGMRILSEQQMQLQQRMTNNAYYAQSLEALHHAEEVDAKEAEAEVWERMQRDSMRERERATSSTTNAPVRSGRDDQGDPGGGRRAASATDSSGAEPHGRRADCKEQERDQAADEKTEEKREKGANAGIDESQDCCVCLAEKKSVVLLPCRHMCVCVACGLDDEQLLSRCPMCRTAIEHRFRVFT